MSRDQIECPREKSFMTPCIARDGDTALADDNVCVGCGADPRQLLTGLAERYAPAARYRNITSPGLCARLLTRMVAEYVASKAMEDT